MTSDTWSRIHDERARLVAALDGLTPEQWRAETLCAGWTPEHVVAHLSAAANTGTAAWLLSMLRAGFDPAKHNARMVERYRGDTPEATLQRFRDSVTATIAPTKDLAGFLGEVIVHGQDISAPLGLALVPAADAVREVAEFFAAKDFAVDSAKLVRGLTLEADDAPFTSGEGPVVRGRLLDLVMAMAGRPLFVDRLNGDGVGELRRRLGAER